MVLVKTFWFWLTVLHRSVNETGSQLQFQGSELCVRELSHAATYKHHIRIETHRSKVKRWWRPKREWMYERTSERANETQFERDGNNNMQKYTDRRIRINETFFLLRLIKKNMIRSAKTTTIHDHLNDEWNQSNNIFVFYFVEKKTTYFWSKRNNTTCNINEMKRKRIINQYIFMIKIGDGLATRMQSNKTDCVIIKKCEQHRKKETNSNVYNKRLDDVDSGNNNTNSTKMKTRVIDALH